MRKLFAFCLMALGSITVLAQNSEQISRVSSVKADPDAYYFAESGPAFSKKQALDAAIEDLARSIHSVVNVDINEADGGYDSRMVIKAAAALDDIHKIEWSNEGDDGVTYSAFVYISKGEYQKQVHNTAERMQERILAMIEEGKIQEGKVNIAEALKFFSQSNHLARFYKINPRDALTDNRMIQSWLDDKIKSILKSIEVTLANGTVEYDPIDPCHYTVNLMVTYDGIPVSSLDVTYFDGTDNKIVAVKNGEAAMKYPELEGRKEVSVNIMTTYSDDIEEDMETAFRMLKPVNYRSFSLKKIPVVIKTEARAIVYDPDEKSGDIDYCIEETSESIPPHLNKVRKEVDRVFLSPGTEDAVYLEAGQAIERALRSRDYASVYHLFEPSALEKFKMMKDRGVISVSKSPDWRFEKASQYIRGGRIPVSVANGTHSRNENIILRFNPDTHKISSIAYALTDNAENDIFRDSQWQLESRYALLKFMEDYQTAYTTKDQNYINSIFNGDAIIITGTVTGQPAKKQNFMKETKANKKVKKVRGILFKNFNKEDFMHHLEKNFHDNSYIYLVFHDAKISKAATPPNLSEAFWIRLKQDYNSQKYNDKGYLSLLIGVKPEGSQIYVRTWTPNAVSMDFLKCNYHFGDQGMVEERNCNDVIEEDSY